MIVIVNLIENEPRRIYRGKFSKDGIFSVGSACIAYRFVLRQ